jgi:hypothetical protein
MDISFAWTTEALLAGKKTVTRRDWSNDYAKRFPVGSIHNATGKQRRFGGRTIGRVMIKSIRREPLMLMITNGNYGRREIEKEGGLWESPEQFVYAFRDTRFGDPYRIEFVFLPRGS